MSLSTEQPDNRLDLTPLLTRARAGDAVAFDRLMAHLKQPVLGSLCKQGAQLEDAEEALGKAMFIVFDLLAKRRFDGMETGGFIAYFRKVAVHEWLHRPDVRHGRRQVSLTAIDKDTGESVDLDLPDGSQPLPDLVANKCLYDFLSAQLDEVFVAGRSGSERDRGEMEKLAFLYFYQDGLTQVEIYDIVAALAPSFPGMAPITRADLNNWLSMGRSLKALLRHLAEHHGEMLGLLIDLHIGSLNLPGPVAETLRAVYQDGHAIEQIAAQRGVGAGEVRQQLTAGKRELVDGLARTIKAQLKVSRSS